MNEDDQKSQTDVAPWDGAVHETDVQLLRKERASAIAAIRKPVR